VRCASFEVNTAMPLKIPVLLGYVYPPYYERPSTFRKKYVDFILKGQINQEEAFETSGNTSTTFHGLTSHKTAILHEIFLQDGKTTFCKVSL
jgi:hypothetical protein